MEDDLERQRRQDAIDFNNELADRETGRLKRFFPNDAQDRAEAAKQREEREFQSALDRMLMDREYARLYEDAQNAIADAQRALDRAILENAQAIERLELLIDDFKDKAATLNGEKVFLSEDGHLYTEGGRRLSSSEASAVEIPANAPSYEQFTQAKDALSGARTRRDDLTGDHQRRIDDAKERMNEGDESNPPSEDTLRDITRDMDRFQQDVQLSSASDFRTASSPQDVQAEAQIDLSADISEVPSL